MNEPNKYPPMPPLRKTMAEIRALMRALYGTDERATEIRTYVEAEEIVKRLQAKWRLTLVSETKFSDEMLGERAARVQRLRRELQNG